MVRYALRLPVIFHWGEQMNNVEGGFTKDIGRDEAFVLSGNCPPIGTHVRMEVLVPSPDSLPGAIRIECSGKVTHVVREDGYCGFLFHGRFYDGRIREEYSRTIGQEIEKHNAKSTSGPYLKEESTDID